MDGIKDRVKDRGDKIVAVLVAALVGKGIEAMSVNDISRQIGCSPTAIRTACDRMFDSDEGWRRITPTTITVPVKSRNYGHHVSNREVRAYKVTRGYLGRLIKAQKESVPPGYVHGAFAPPKIPWIPKI